MKRSEISRAIAEVATYESTHIVSEVCPHCESEIEMHWDTDVEGFKAYCPVCGKRLMLCDACQHRMDGCTYMDDCDYCTATDSCRFNPHVE